MALNIPDAKPSDLLWYDNLPSQTREIVDRLLLQSRPRCQMCYDDGYLSGYRKGWDQGQADLERTLIKGVQDKEIQSYQDKLNVLQGKIDDREEKIP